MTTLTLDEAFPITPEERAGFDAAPFRGVDEDRWQAFAAFVHEEVLAGYAAGETDFRRMMKVMRSCSLPCRQKDRITLLALTADRALRVEPAHRKRPPNPTWVMHSAAALVSMLREARPDEPLAPTDSNGYSTPIINDAIRQLVTLGLCESIDPRTLYTWYLAQKKTATPPTSPLPD